MATAGARDSTADQTPKKRSRWIWISVLLVILAAGLLIWALTIQSDLDSTQDELASTQQELDAAREELDGAKQDLAEATSERDQRLRTGLALVSGKALYDRFAEELDATNQDLAATQQDLEEAEKTATQAERDAEKAKQAAADAGTETEKAKAEADQATADVEAAQSRAAVAADCAKAYISAFGALFEGDSPEDQAPAVREELAGVTATCKDDLAGT
jgi:DNA repair exonuclease SbcCD ATPase subunit